MSSIFEGILDAFKLIGFQSNFKHSLGVGGTPLSLTRQFHKSLRGFNLLREETLRVQNWFLHLISTRQVPLEDEIQGKDLQRI